MVKPPVLCQVAECTQIQRVKLEMQLEVVRVLDQKVSPLLRRMEETSEKMAVHAERLATGAEQFKTHHTEIENLKEWRHRRDGELKEGDKSSKRTASKWAIGVSIMTSAFFKAVDWVVK